MLHQFSRNELAIGTKGLDALRHATVTVVGIGGVGSFAAEALARSAVGKIILIDKDIVDITNINRQLHATTKTIGQSKCEVMKKRILDINPQCIVETLDVFINRDNIDLVFDQNPDFIVEAVDTILIKSLIIMEAFKQQTPIICSMGAANKLDPTAFKIANIWDTRYDPIAKIIRRDLKRAKLGLRKLMVVYSEEKPIVPKAEVLAVIGNAQSHIRKQEIPPSSNAFVPSVVGLICASFVVNEIIANAGVTFERKGNELPNNVKTL
ncbi:tRNA threonylcarbamoyladenosine dehydratase [Erysipelotrichaceae bacterium]|nr:tRNA threonylcarbamoyladenosine dehydratase [Erysipelotrichaceae bacterium]